MSSCFRCRKKQASAKVREEYDPFQLCNPCYETAIEAREGNTSFTQQSKRSERSMSTADGDMDATELDQKVHTNNCETNACSLIHNELLYFVQNQLDAGMTNDDLCIILLNFYTTEECISAKHIMVNMLLCNGINVPESKTRTGANKVKQVIQDIIHLLQMPAFTNEVPRVRFVAAYSDRVPPIGFKTLDVSVLLSTIKKVEQEVNEMKRSCVKREELPLFFGEQAPSPTPQSGARDYAHAVMSAGEDTRKSSRESGRERVKNNHNNLTTSTSKTAKKQQQQSPSVGVKEKAYTRPPRGGGSRSLVIGKSTDHKGNLKAVNSRPIQIFVSRLDPSTSENEIADHVKEATGVEIKVKKQETKYDSYSSFLLTCQLNEKQRLLDANLWPTNTLIKPWFPPSQKKERKTVLGHETHGTTIGN